MARLTRREMRLLRRTADLVRMYVACITVLGVVLCVVYAKDKYDRITAAGGIPEIPPASTYGTIAGIYLPLFAAVAAYVWATRAAPTRNLAPNGFAMALFRDGFTMVVVTLVLLVPPLLYRSTSMTLQSANPFLVWYQTVITAVAGAAFTYYFHASIAPAPSTDADDEAPPRRRPVRPRPDEAGLET